MTKIINGGLAVDDRGSLRYINDFNPVECGIKRFYQVENFGQVIRAWHGHKKEGKYVYVVKGSALVGTVNLETEEVQKFVLSASSPKVLYIPPNYANGFITLEEGTILMFFSTSTLEDSKGDDIRFPFDKWNIWQVENR
jgi:dTDP-4-dehydrorhamnose 3,5-epimerase